MKKIVLLAILVLAFSCKKEEKEKVANESCAKEKSTGKKGFQMYEMSEMAALMEQMYVDNLRLKDRIIKGDTIGKFPQHFVKIHSAVMSDGKDNDDFFKIQAKKFIQAQELIYKDPVNAKQHFNNGVQACLNCHEQKCGGPIPRIKKLFIK
ncbi:hypothetical protein GCM10011508_22390 [Flavobacterium lutivivi]|nr:hypothetical protein GCM10011508_22390 [Flavobacterium lutivivi]